MHTPRKLAFADLPGRDYWWNLLGEAVQHNIEQKVGPPIEWWAYRHPTDNERPYAVVFGPNGLALTTPTVNNAGGPAHLVRVRRFDPGSVRYAIVQQQPSAGSTPHADAGSGAAPRLPLTEDVRGFLGNLPTEAQARLQEPFLGDDPVQDSDYHYYGTDEQVDVWCYLAGSRAVTFASGQRVASVGAPALAAWWYVVCRRAEVIQG